MGAEDYRPLNVPDIQHSVFYAYSIIAVPPAGGEPVPIGSFERFGAKSTRSHERIREIMFSRGPEVKEIVWGGTDTSIDISRVELYQMGVIKAFGSPVFALEHFNQAVDIHEVREKKVAGIYTASEKQTIVYEQCVATAWGKDLDTGTVRVVESMTFEVSRVSGFVGD